MIKHSFLVFLTISVIYTGYLYVIKPIGEPQGIYQERFIKYENYLYSEDTYSVVVIGTSLTNNLKFFEENFYNLSSGGGDIFQQLEAVLLKEQKPKLVSIEMNMFFKNDINEDYKNIFSTSHIKERVPLIQERHQIVSVIGKSTKIVTDYCSRKLNSCLKWTFDEQKEKALSKDSDFIEKFISKQIISSQKIPESRISKNIVLLKEYLKVLKKSNIEVVFHYVPLDCRLEKCNLYTETYQLFNNEFSKFLIPKMDCSGFSTSDGLHLDPSSAIKYSGFLKAHLKSFGNTKLRNAVDTVGRL